MSDDFRDLQAPATRADIHRLRGELQQMLAPLQLRQADVDSRLTRLEVEAKPVIAPIELGRRMEQIDDLTEAVEKLTRIGEENSRRIWKAVGAVSVIAPAITLVAQVFIRGL